jgi:hypothetical protein
MTKYIIFSDYEKGKKLREIEEEKLRLDKSLYWILKQMGIPRSTYYDWKKTGGKTESRAPKTVWNKTPLWIEKEIVGIREDDRFFNSERSPLGISTKLEEKGIFMNPSGIYEVLKRYGINRKFKERHKLFLIYPKAERFMDTVCIDDVSLTNKKPRDLSVFNAIDEYSGESVAILFVSHRINRWDVVELMEIIKKRYNRLPKIVRLDNAKAHLSNVVKAYCLLHGIELQFINKGTPQQNWPVESFNKVLKHDLLVTQFWGGWEEFGDKQKILEEYIEYYDTVKRLPSDSLNRTPREISTGVTSISTQRRLKIRLIRKQYGQVAGRQAMMKQIQNHTASLPLITVPDLSEMCVR